jgi:hypothetical protein
VRIELGGIGFAMCCHHLCQWPDYVAQVALHGGGVPFLFFIEHSLIMRGAVWRVV